METPEKCIPAFAFLLWSLAVFGAGWASCHYYEKPRAIPVIAHDQVRQKDGSLIAARVSTPQPPQQIVPKGDQVQATAQIHLAAHALQLKPGVQVQQKSAGDAGLPAVAVASGPTVAQLDDCERWLQCPAVTVDETLVRGKDGQQDLLVSTPDGQVQSASLAPVGPVLAAPVHPWLIGPSYGRGGWGLVAGRQFQALPVAVGVDAWRDPQAGLDARVWGVWRF